MKVNGAALRVIRKQQGWTLAQFGEAVGLSESRLSHIEKDGEGTTGAKVKKFAEVLAVPVAAITSDSFPLADVLRTQAAS